MNYKWFVLILMASSAATVALAIWKGLGRQNYPCNYLGERAPTLIGRLSWFAVPWPLFLGIAILALPYIQLVLIWQD